MISQYAILIRQCVKSQIYSRPSYYTIYKRVLISHERINAESIFGSLAPHLLKAACACRERQRWLLSIKQVWSKIMVHACAKPKAYIQIIYYCFIIINSNKYSSLLYCRNNHTFGKRVDYSVTLSIKGMHVFFVNVLTVSTFCIIEKGSLFYTLFHFFAHSFLYK
jgi:hypothetical protein